MQERQFCPSCRARRLAEWSLWLDERLLAPVAHRQVVLTLPKRLRAYMLHDRRRLVLLSRVAARTLRAHVQAAVGEREGAGLPLRPSICGVSLRALGGGVAIGAASDGPLPEP